jgi:hypothetical protein
MYFHLRIDDAIGEEGGRGKHNVLHLLEHSCRTFRNRSLHPSEPKILFHLPTSNSFTFYRQSRWS